MTLAPSQRQTLPGLSMVPLAKTPSVSSKSAVTTCPCAEASSSSSNGGRHPKPCLRSTPFRLLTAGPLRAHLGRLPLLDQEAHSVERLRDLRDLRARARPTATSSAPAASPLLR
eukprot:scaffold1040_cov376-Prasinococcus_capsulatus_cf.AAC.2